MSSLPPVRHENGEPEPKITDLVDLSAQPDGIMLPFLAVQKPLDLEGKTPSAIVRAISDHMLKLPCVTYGLDNAYSPNHTTGMTTRVHIEKQLIMVNHYVGSEMRAVEALGRGDYAALHKMIDNPQAPAPLRISQEDLERLLEPMRQGLQSSDWKVLTVVAGLHDLGKMSADWAAASGMNLDGVDWIAHDYDSETLLRHNPEMLSPFSLSNEEREKALTLCRLHSLPGQFFFGEGNVSAYKPLFRTASQEKNEAVLNLARIHGVLDVMSALNEKMVKPILDSHFKLRTFITDAFAQQTPLGMKFRQTAVEELRGGGYLDVANQYGVGPVAMQRLRSLTGPKLSASEFEKAFASLDKEMIYEFHDATDGERTWFGTYVANSFGSGMLKSVKDKASAAEVIACMVKMIACAARYHRQLEQQYGYREEWAIGSLQPSLAVVAGEGGALEVLRETQRFDGVQQGVDMMAGGASRLTLRGGHSGVEIGYTKS